MPFVNILSPSGHNLKLELNQNILLSEPFLKACNRQKLNPVRHQLLHKLKPVDLANSFQHSHLVNQAQLELVPLTNWKPISIKLAIRLENSKRIFWEGSNLESFWMIIQSIKEQDESLLKLVDDVANTNTSTCLSLFSSRIIGNRCLKLCSPEFLGIRANGVALNISTVLITDEIKKEEITTFQTLESFHTLCSLENQMEIDDTEINQPVMIEEINATPATREKDPLIPEINNLIAVQTPFGIFDNRPNRSIFDQQETDPPKIVKAEKSLTLGELLGINLESSSGVNENTDSENFIDFKFPEETAGMDLTAFSDITYSNQKQSCDREICIFTKLKNLPSASLHSGEIELEEDSIYEVTEQDLRLLLFHLRKEAGNEANLESANLRQIAKERRIAEKYSRCIIRFQFERPEDFLIVQACFLPTEQVSELYNLLKLIIKDCPSTFDLFTTPPKNLLNKHQGISLISANLVPLTTVHFSSASGFIADISDLSNVSLNFSKEMADHIVTNSLNLCHKFNIPTNDDPKKKSIDSGHKHEKHMMSGSSSGIVKNETKGPVPKWFKSAK